MSLSKFNLQDVFLSYFSDYIQAIYTNPIRTKALTSCFLSSCGNLTSQLIGGSKEIDWNNLKAFSLFGLLFGGTLPHYFFILLDKLVPRKSNYPIVKRLLIERLLYAPFYQMFSLYMLSLFEGKSSEEAFDNMTKLFWPVLKANWRILTIVQFTNLAYVPGIFRVLVLNFVGFFWNIFLATKRRQALK